MALRASYYGLKKRILDKVLGDYDSSGVMTNRELMEKKANDMCLAGTYTPTPMIVSAIVPSNAHAPEFFIPWTNPQKKRPTFDSLKVYDRSGGSWTELEQSDPPNIYVSENGFFINVVLTNALTSNSEKLLKIECKLTFS